jgi:RimJ/RimL family protein N-acetyltransferase
MKLETERLVLRPVKEADVPFLFPLINDIEVARNMRAVPHPYPKKRLFEWIRSAREAMFNKSALEMAVVLRENGCPIGVCALNRIDWDVKSAEIGYWLGRQYWGCGYMTEAVKAMVYLAFAYLGLERIYAYRLEHNIASIRVLKKAGLRYEEVAEDLMDEEQGHLHLLRFGILKHCYQVDSYGPKWCSVEGVDEWLTAET